MKKMILVLLIMTAGTLAFASGAQETNENGVVELERGQLARDSYLADLEKIEITGTLVFESPVPELKVGSKQYSLMAPGARMFAGYVSEGTRMTVSGYIMDEESCAISGRGYGMQNLDAIEGNAVLMVETVEIDGTEYQLPGAEDGFGGRGGMMFDNQGSYGRQGGRMNGSNGRGFGQRPF